MYLYLIASDYEGCEEIVFSTQELAEEYLDRTQNLYASVIRVTLDSNESELMPDSPARIAERKTLEATNKREMDEWRAEQICEICGVQGYKACRCNAEVSCGDFGGVTKKGEPCLNVVLKREATPCHLHR